MKKIWTQIKYHFKKEKGSYISFGIIVLFTAFMLNLALVLTFQVDKAYDEKFETLHTATVNVAIPKIQDTEELKEELEQLPGVTQMESREAIFSETVVKEFRGIDFSMNTFFYNLEEKRNLNQLEVKEESPVQKDQSIYLPLYVASFGEFETGEEIVYEIGETSYTFSIAGVMEEMQYGNYGKGLMGAYLSGGSYEALSKELEGNLVIEYSLLTDETCDMEQIKKEVSSLLDDKDIMMISMNDSVSTKDMRTMICDLLILILTAFSLVILLVSVFLCKFRISNSIEEEIVNMGVLEAIGYTGNMIIGSIVWPYILVSVVAALLGVCGSYGVLPVLSHVLTLQSGFSFALTFDGMSLICVELLLAGVVFFFAYGSARKIRRIQPIQAMRGSGEEGSKSADGKQKVLLFFVSFVLTILVAFASTLFYNVIIKPDNFMNTLSEEMPEAVIYPKEDTQEALADILKKDKRVDQVLQYSVLNVEMEETAVSAFVCEDFNKVSNDLCYLGENPKTENEIALGSIFAENYEIGDLIQLSNGEQTYEYKITGFVQSVNYQGNICELTVEGYENLCDGEFVSSLYVYLQEGETAEKFLEDYTTDDSDKIVNAVDCEKNAKTAQEMYSSITTIIILAIFVLTILIVLFILYIVIRSLLVQKKQEFGIYKAIGYSNWQLMAQLVGSSLPVSAAGVLLSSLLGIIYLPYMNQFIFQSVGAMKNHMEISLVFLLVFAGLQIAANLVISVVMSMPIKKISVYSLLKE